MIFLKGKLFNKNVLKRAFIVFFSGLIFFFCSYVYLNLNLKNDTQAADQKDYTVPYEQVPQNACVVFVFPSDNAYFVNLDFESRNIKLVTLENFDPKNQNHYGYTADYMVECDYQLLVGLIDRIGGVNLTLEKETLRYTGVQVIDLIATGSFKKIKTQLLSQIFDQIAKNGFSKEDLVYIIENSESNLSVVDCIYWLDYIVDMSSRVSFVN